MLEKKAILLFLVGLLAVFCLSVPAWADVTPSLEVSAPSQVNVDDTFNVSVNVNNVTELAGVQFYLSYDSAVLEVTGDLATGNIFTNPFEAIKEYDNASGIIEYYAIVIPPQTYSGSGTVLTINFEAKASGTCPLTLSNTLLAKSDSSEISEINHTVTSSSVTVINQNAQAPQVTSRTPAVNATNVDLNEPVSATFNMDVTVVDLSGVTIKAGSTPVTGVSASLATNNRTINITHDTLAYNTLYTVTIPAGAVENSCGLTNDQVSWNFTTKEQELTVDVSLVGDNISPERPLTINGEASQSVSWQVVVKDSSGQVVKDYPAETGTTVDLQYTPEMDLPVVAEYSAEVTTTPSGGATITKTFNVYNYPLKITTVNITGSGDSRMVSAEVANLDATDLADAIGICQVTKTDANGVSVVYLTVNEPVTVSASGATLQFNVNASEMSGDYQVEVYLWSNTENGWATLGQPGTADLTI